MRKTNYSFEKRQREVAKQISISRRARCRLRVRARGGGRGRRRCPCGRWRASELCVLGEARGEMLVDLEQPRHERLWPHLQPHLAVKSTPARGGMKIMLVACAPCTLTSRSVHARRLACAARLSALGSQTSRNHGSRLLTAEGAVDPLHVLRGFHKPSRRRQRPPPQRRETLRRSQRLKLQK